jgi:electron transport complex protein RnfE
VSAAPAGAPAREDFLRGIWRENPVLIQVLGLCPTLAVTNTVANSLAMGAATTFVLVASSVLVASVKGIVPHQVRISAYILIIATFVTIAEMVLQATVPDIHKELGPFVALIVVNCIILGRMEAFASRHSVGRAVMDAAGNSVGFTLVLLLMGGFREVLGNGSFLGRPLFGSSYEPWIVMILPPGGFFTLGLLLLVIGWRRRRQEERPRIRRWPLGVGAPREQEAAR